MISAGESVGRWTLRERRPAPAGFVAWSLVDDDAHELIVPNAHLRLRAGARDAWAAARAERARRADVALPEADWVEAGGWPCWVRPRGGPFTLESLGDDDRAALAGWLGAAGVDLGAATAEDLAVTESGEVRYAPLGLGEHAPAATSAQDRARRTLAILLGPPGAPRPVRVTPTEPSPLDRGAPASTAVGGAAILRLPPAPLGVIVVRVPAGDAAAIRTVARRTATLPAEVARAAQGPGWWAWAATSTKGPAARLRGQAERAGLTVELRPTEAPSPNFLPALVAGGVAQIPLYVSTGIPELDFAVLAGLGATSLFSLVRAGRRIAPARSSAAAVGAWAAWSRATRTDGPELALLALELRLDRPEELGPAATDLADALDEAWARLFAVPDGRSRATDRLGQAAHTILRALDEPDSPRLVAAIRALKAG